MGQDDMPHPLRSKNVFELNRIQTPRDANPRVVETQQCATGKTRGGRPVPLSLIPIRGEGVHTHTGPTLVSTGSEVFKTRAFYKRCPPLNEGLATHAHCCHTPPVSALKPGCTAPAVGHWSPLASSTRVTSHLWIMPDPGTLSKQPTQ